MIGFDTDTSAPAKVRPLYDQATKPLMPHEKAMLAHDGYLANDPRKPEAGCNGQMVFIRKDDRGYWLRAFGIRGAPANELPMSGGADRPLAGVLEAIRAKYLQAWLLIAP